MWTCLRILSEGTWKRRNAREIPETKLETIVTSCFPMSPTAHVLTRDSWKVTEVWGFIADLLKRRGLTRKGGELGTLPGSSPSSLCSLASMEWVVLLHSMLCLCHHTLLPWSQLTRDWNLYAMWAKQASYKKGTKPILRTRNKTFPFSLSAEVPGTSSSTFHSGALNIRGGQPLRRVTDRRPGGFHCSASRLLCTEQGKHGNAISQKTWAQVSKLVIKKKHKEKRSYYRKG